MKSLLPLLLCIVTSSGVRGAFPSLYLKPVVLQQLNSPTCIVAPPDGSGRLFVCDQAGQIRIIKGDMLFPVPFMDISSTAATAAHRKVIPVTTGYSERGLLSLAFHPGYADSQSPGYRKFYVNYNKTYLAGQDPGPHDGGSWTPNCVTVIAEFQVSASDPDVADPASERRLLLFPQPQSNHNGGSMVFDTSGLLYVGSGDGGSADDNNVGHTGGANSTPRPTGALGNGQDKTVFLGKILRINPLDPDGPGDRTYGIPGDNPFVGAGGGVKEEIYAYGIRNPWGLSFDGGVNPPRLYGADVGQGRIEEVNLIVSGGNYGWRYMEGTERPAFSSTMTPPAVALIEPIAQYGHPDITGTTLPLLGLSITGGHVYRGAAIPALQGKYVFGDYGSTGGSASGRLMGLEETAPGSGVFTLTEALPLIGGNPLSTRVLCLGRDGAGELYVGTKSSGGVLATENGLPNGGIYKMVAAPVNPVPITLTAVKDNSMFSESGALNQPLSNGQGPLFVGTSANSEIRRALLQFDLSGVPAGSRFSSAMLQMHVTASETGSASQRNTLLHRVLASWGEGPSFNPGAGAAALEGDATWLHRFYSATAPIPWENEGADFSPVVSAAIGINSQTGFRSLFGPQLTRDVHDWLAVAGSNHGWLLTSSDAPAVATTKTLASREDGIVARRPTLTLVHASPFENWLAAYFPGNLTGQWVDPDGDSDGDSTGLLLEYARGSSPLSRDPQSGMEAMVSPLNGTIRELTASFLRDTTATDLTYRLEISPDLVTWTTIAHSTGGSAATGQNGGSVTGEVAEGGSVKRVSVTRALEGQDAVKQFLRLAVERAPF
jgi:glucose/arabinose dehydrogenase